MGGGVCLGKIVGKMKGVRVKVKLFRGKIGEWLGLDGEVLDWLGEVVILNEEEMGEEWKGRGVKLRDEGSRFR